jgi:GAF domain-containing protein
MLHAHSLIVAPLVAAGQKIGYIQATYIEAIGLTERNLRQLESLTRQAAIAVQNIRQLETIEARAQRERTIREITERIQQAPDVQGVLQAAVREVSRAFGTSRSRIQFRAPRRYYEEEPSRPEAEAAEDDQEQA